MYAQLWRMEEDPAIHATELAKIRAKNPDIRIVYFTHKPFISRDYMTVNRLAMGYQTPDAINRHFNEVVWLRKKEDAYMAQIAAENKVALLNTSEIFCGEECVFYRDGFHYFDQAHWTDRGAAYFLSRLQQLPKYRAVFYGEE